VIKIKREMEMSDRQLTAKQQAVATLRYDRKATIQEIAKWLNITHRAVYYRLRNIRRRTAGRAGGSLVYPAIAPSGRRYSASQISTIGGPTPTLSLDQV
jgi:DNA-binding CsgD family transcriptional regulator